MYRKKEIAHMIDYTEINRRFADKDIRQYTVKQLKILSGGTLAKIGANNGDHVSTATIEEICQLLQCQPWDLLKDWKVELDPAKSIESLRALYKHEKNAKKEGKA